MTNSTNGAALAQCHSLCGIIGAARLCLKPVPGYHSPAVGNGWGLNKKKTGTGGRVPSGGPGLGAGPPPVTGAPHKKKKKKKKKSTLR
eukprot:NODE_20144_length_811_cov_2.274854.p3 GENE.NODE_20144_length_811_cov_2.274854~~NODE_20144_length_811_cov_2.274854.p3  ORF type:complete len:88 (+),score=6.47 NODE_20144_length_811_cov_2.274854:545-808(+)